MKIKSLHIKNFKSIVDLTINEPNPFTVFVGPNGSGKSNIFEALEFAKLMTFEFDFDKKNKIENLFGGAESFLNFDYQNKDLVVSYEFDEEVIVFGRTLKNDQLLNTITQAKVQLNQNKVKIMEYLTKISGDKETSNNVKLLFSTDKFDKILSPKYESFSFTFPIKKDAINNLNSITEYNENNLNYIFGATEELLRNSSFEQFFVEFSRIFIGSRLGDKTNNRRYLKSDASNLEKAVSYVLEDNMKRQELLEWLQLFIPEFVNIEYNTNEINGKKNLQIFEKKSKKPFNTALISDGTYNIIALLIAVYQSDEPQFLCIEEPENGLNPYVIRKLVDFFRNACEEKGHYIWLNTHSQTLVECLSPEEVILVDKIDGETKVKQIKGKNLYGLDVAEAWLSGALGGGTPW